MNYDQELKSLPDRIRQRQEELGLLESELLECKKNLAFEQLRQRELARKYNNKLAFLGYLLDD